MRGEKREDGDKNIVELCEVAERRTAMSVKPKEKIMNVDYFDLCWEVTKRGEGLYDESRIEQLIVKCAKEGFDTLHWRVSECGKVAYHSRVMTMFDAEYRLCANFLGEILKRFDPLEVAANYARKYGLKIYPWVTLFDSYYPGLEDRFFAEHPQYLMISRDGLQAFKGVPCYAYPEVRQYRLAEVKELMQYDVDGILYCVSNSHTPAEPVPEDFWGYNDPVVEEYKRRYGVDIRKEDDFDREAWYRLQGEYLTQYLREVRAELKKQAQKMIVVLKREKYSIGGGAVYPALRIDIDWRSYIQEGIAEGLVFHIGPAADIGGLEKYKLWIGKQARVYPWYTVWAHFATRSQVEEVIEEVRQGILDGIVFHEAATFEFSKGGDIPAVADVKDEEGGLWGLVRRIKQ